MFLISFYHLKDLDSGIILIIFWHATNSYFTSKCYSVRLWAESDVNKNWCWAITGITGLTEESILILTTFPWLLGATNFPRVPGQGTVITHQTTLTITRPCSQDHPTASPITAVFKYLKLMMAVPLMSVCSVNSQYHQYPHITRESNWGEERRM